MEDFLQIDQLLTEEECLIRDTVRRFVDESVTPVIADAYENAQFPETFIQKTAELGLLGMTLPEEYGGSNTSAISYGLACQELERGDSGLRSFVSVQSSLVMYPIFTYGSEEQKQRWLPAMARGEKIGCFGLTEPDSGSDPASMRTNAKKVDGGWVLNGNKMWITNAPIADCAVVWAKTEDGVCGFIVEREFDGFTTPEIKHKLSLRASRTGEIALQDVFVPEANRLPNAKGMRAPLSCLSQARFGIAWGAMGAAMACFEIARDYCLNRKQFDKPLAQFQMIQHDLVEMFSEIVKAQALNWQLGRLKVAGDITPEMISLGKRNACANALAIARSARNLLGGNGISLEYHVIRHMTNLESVFTYEGTDNIHTLVLGKHITGLNAFA